MPIFEYICPDCKILEEKIFQSLDKSPKEIECPRCKGMSPRKEIPSSISLSRSSMDNAPIDNFIGKDAEMKWNDIKERQDKRNKVRSETGSLGLSQVGRNEYVPVSEDNVRTREEVSKSMGEAPKIVPGQESTSTWLKSISED